MPVLTPPETRQMSQAYLKLDGADVQTSVMADLLRVRVEGSVHLPDMAELEFDNPDMTLSDQALFKPGQQLQISFGRAEEKNPEPVFDGEIVATNLELGTLGSVRLKLRAYDRAHRLHRGRNTQVFKNMSDSDIASQIAQREGFQADVQSTSPVHDYVLQDNQTDWEFLRQRAAIYGFEVQVAGKTVLFKPPPSKERESVSLAWKQQLTSFSATMTTGDQVNEVVVRGWDPVKKEVVTGKATTPQGLPQVGESRTGGQVSKEAFKNTTSMVVVRQPVFSQAHAERVAQTVLNELSGSFITARGTAMGDPKLELGSKVEIKSVGQQFTGKYQVTQITHHFQPENWTTDFEATGRRSTDLVSLVSSPPPAGPHLVVGVVTDTRDPQNLGRVKVKLPLLSDSESFWCRLVAPGAGKDRGIEFLPEVEDEVLLIGNSMDNLYVLGGVWNQQDPPPLGNDEAAPSGGVQKRVIRSRTGHEITIDDGSDGGVTVVDSNGNKFQLKTGNDSLVIEVAGDIDIKAKRSIKIEAQGNVDLKSATGNASLEALANVTVKGNASATLQDAGADKVEVGAGRIAVAAPQISLGM